MATAMSRARILASGALALLVWTAPGYAQAVPYFEGFRQAENPDEVATVIEILILLTVLSLAPSFLVQDVLQSVMA